MNLRTKNKPISYCRIPESFLKVLKVLNWRKYGLYSLQSDGASLVCQIDFSSDKEDGSQIGQRTGISKIV